MRGALAVMADSDQPDLPIWLQMSTIGEEATDLCVSLGAGEHGDEDVSATYLTSAPDQAA